jgi:plasmid stability protein
MASITIRNLNDDLKKRLRIRAAEHGRSMEEEARDILRDVLEKTLPPRPKTGLEMFREIRALVEPLGGIELEPLPREPIRDPPDFSSPEFGRNDEE